MTLPLPDEPGLPALLRVRRAIMVVDLVDAVRILQRHEADALAGWQGFVAEVQRDVLPTHRGRVVRGLGDGLLLAFADAHAAVAAAMVLPLRLARWNRSLPDAAWIRLRVGVHVSEVVVDELDLFGAGVDLAARLAAAARPGEVVASAEVHDELSARVRADLDVELEDRGGCALPHQDPPARCFLVRPAPPAVAAVRPAAAAGPEAPSAPGTCSPGLAPSAPPRRPDAAAATRDDAAWSRAPVIAVVPFAARDGSDPRQHALGDALADRLIGALSCDGRWRIVSRLSTAPWRDPALALPRLRAALNADLVLRGLCWLDADRLHWQAELVHAGRQQVLWTQAGELPLAAFLAGDDTALLEAARAVARATGDPRLPRALALPTRTLASYALLRAGTRWLHGQGRRDFDRSRDWLLQAHDRVPRAAAPLAMLAKWHVLRITQGWTQDAAGEREQARAQARLALQRQPDEAFALTVDAWVALQRGGQLELALTRIDQALQGNPQEPYAWATLAGLHACRDEGDAAVTAAARALELSPRDPQRFVFDTGLAAALVVAGRPALAQQAAQSALRAHRGLVATHRVLALAHAMQGQWQAARASVQQLLALQPRASCSGFAARYAGRDSAHLPEHLRLLREAGLPA